MKKILIVEDTQANLDAAKAFFETISGFEFIFATNKEDAEVALAEADALITDRDLPYFTGDNQEYDIENGYMLGVLAKMQGKPVLMLTEHGELMISEVNASHENFMIAEEAVQNLAGLKGVKSCAKHGEQEGVYVKAHIGKLIDVTHRGSGTIYSFDHINGSKKDKSAWQIAWERLQKQF